jgi:hypothetical protein
MARQPCTFRQRDVAAAIKAARAAGIEVARVEVAADGTIRVIAGKPCENGQGNPWDVVVEELVKR